MQLPPLTEGRILRRYKRFLADVELADGSLITAHCPNTGTMRTCWAAGARVQVSHSDNPKRKLPWTLERVDMGAGWVGVHTGRVNAVIAEAVARGAIPALAGFARVRQEVTVQLPGLPRGRLDLGLYEGAGADTLVEIKNTTLYDGGCVRFPDAVTERGCKHLDLLAALRQSGLRAVILFAVNRPEGDCVAAAGDIDPAYARRLAEVVEAGVEALAVRIRHGAQELVAGECLPIRPPGR